MKMVTNLLLVFTVFMAAGVFQTSTAGKCPCSLANTPTPSCSDRDAYITCLEGVTADKNCDPQEVTDAATEKIKAQADKLRECPVCPTCIEQQSPTCSAYSSYLNCLRNVTVANHCADTEVVKANDDKEKTQAELSKLKCSGATNLVNSIFFILVLSLMTRTLNGN